jgi:hypothetical protein
MHLKGILMFWIKRTIYYQVVVGRVTGTLIEKNLTITRTSKGFSHPRTVIGDFYEIESTFKEIAKELAPQKFLFQNHTAIIHFLQPVEGGLTNIESRALREAAFGAGARETFMVDSPTKLSGEQILKRTFKELDGA